jgi:hypothetical protein
MTKYLNNNVHKRFYFYKLNKYIVNTCVIIKVNCCKIITDLPRADFGYISVIPTPDWIVTLKNSESKKDGLSIGLY